MRPLTFARPLALLALLALPAAAQRADFAGLTQPLTRQYAAALGEPLTNGGLDFYNVDVFSNPNFGGFNAFTVWGTSDPGSVNRPANLNGSNAIFTNPGGETDIVLSPSPQFGFANTPLFGLASIDFAHVYSDAYTRGALALAPLNIRIFGTSDGATSFFQDFVFPLAPVDANGFRTPVLRTAVLDGRFTQVQDVWFVQSTSSGSAFQFTNVVMATPEPASLVLLGTGLLGVFAVVRRRKEILAS